MKGKMLVTLVALAAVTALDAYAVYLYGYVGFVRQEISNVAAITGSVDMVIALTMVAIWMVQDAKERGVSSVPYLIVLFFLGSVGPLLYLVRRFAAENEPQPVRTAAPVRS